MSSSKSSPLIASSSSLIDDDGLGTGRLLPNRWLKLDERPLPNRVDGVVGRIGLSSASSEGDDKNDSDPRLPEALDLNRDPNDSSSPASVSSFDDSPPNRCPNRALLDVPNDGF